MKQERGAWPDVPVTRQSGFCHCLEGGGYSLLRNREIGLTEPNLRYILRVNL